MRCRTGSGRVLAVALAAAAIAATPAPAAVQRISFGPNGGNGANDVNFERATPDLAKVACTSTEQLTADDTDDTFDLFFCAGAASERLSTGPTGGNETGTQTIHYEGVDLSADGSHVFFGTSESLVSGDTDTSPFPYGQQDIYERTGATTNWVSTGPSDTNAGTAATGVTASADGSRVIFFGGKLTSDSPAFNNFYVRQGSSITYVAGSPNMAPDDFMGGSADLSRLVFTSIDPYASDSDTAFDMFGWNAGTTTLLSPGPGPPSDPGIMSPAFISVDGSRVLFLTDSALVSADTDTSVDLYLASGGTVTLLSTGPTGANAAEDVIYAGASADATHAFFCTNEALVAADTDTERDLYESLNGTTTLVSQGAGGSGPSADACVDDGVDEGNDRNSVSVAGDRVAFRTAERLLPQDTDSSDDIYERAGGVTTLVSTGPAGGNAAKDATWVGSSADVGVIYFTTTESLVAADTDTANDVYARINGTDTVLITPPPVAGPASGSDIARAGNTNIPKRRPVSADGQSIVISTRERLTADDTDSSVDLYRGSVSVPSPTPTPTPTPTPAPTPPATTAPAAAPAPALSKLPRFSQIVTLPSTKVCASRRHFRIRVRIPKGLAVRSVTVSVNGKRVAVHRGRRLTAPVDLRRLPKGAFKVKVAIALADGRVVSDSRRYHTCVRKRRRAVKARLPTA